MKQQIATNQKWKKITKDERNIAKYAKPVKPGPAQIPNFWLKKLNTNPIFLANALNEIMVDPNQSPEWLTQGNTYLVAKEQNTQNPKNYRPITCLPTIYKTLTSILAKKTYSYLENFQKIKKVLYLMHG